MRIEVDPVHGEAPHHNLMASAVPLSADGDNRWEQGVTWEQLSCSGVFNFRQICNTTVQITGSATSGGQGTNDPYVYYMPYGCQVTTEEARVKQFIDERLAIGASKKLEEVFWADLTLRVSNVDGTGTSATTGILNQTYLTPVAVNPELALATASQALGKCTVGARGMIHATPYLVSRWGARNYLCMDDAGRLMTRSRGDIVVCGNGYSGAGPSGNASATPATGTTWVFVTPMVGVRWSEVRHVPGRAEAVDRATNLVRWTAEQTIGYQVDGCCSFALLVDVT